MDKTKWLWGMDRLQGSAEGEVNKGYQKKEAGKTFQANGTAQTKTGRPARARHARGPSRRMSWSNTWCLRAVSPKMVAPMGTRKHMAKCVQKDQSYSLRVTGLVPMSRTQGERESTSSLMHKGRKAFCPTEPTAGISPKATAGGYPQGSTPNHP